MCFVCKDEWWIVGEVGFDGGEFFCVGIFGYLDVGMCMLVGFVLCGGLGGCVVFGYGIFFGMFEWGGFSGIGVFC